MWQPSRFEWSVVCDSVDTQLLTQCTGARLNLSRACCPGAQDGQKVLLDRSQAGLMGNSQGSNTFALVPILAWV